MARLKYRIGDEAYGLLLDPSDDPIVIDSFSLGGLLPFATEALRSPTATLPPQALEHAADEAQPHLPAEIPPLLTTEAQEVTADATLQPAAQSIATLAPLEDLFCPRQISFTIPGAPGVQVTATENGGNIDFVADVLDTPTLTADLRGLFFHFDEADLAGLTVTGGDGTITKTVIQANSVMNLGNGNNLIGAALPFDIGIAFGTQGIGKDDISFPVSFTLDGVDDLTLDDFAHLEFGARLTSIGTPGGKRSDSSKVTTIAPAAPDAVDDDAKLFEDGASGLSDPSKTPTAVLFNVLENDTDADFDPLTVIAFHEGPSHGTVMVAPNGDVLYTPFLDYSGPDSFVYCVSDGNGGQDHATVNVTVEAVADKPTIDVQVFAGANVHEAILRVTATQNDADSSEFIDRLETSVAGGLPAGVTITPFGPLNPGDEPDLIVQDFVVTLPAKQDIRFNLDITAFSKETSNGDEERATVTREIWLDFNHNAINRTFEANDRSIWSNAEAIGFKDKDFFGAERTFGDDPEFTVPAIPIAPPAPIFVNATVDVDGHFKFGFEYDIEINGGKINADAPFEITVDTTYNRTTDVLVIDAASQILPGLSFTTEGPGGHFFLDAVADIALNVDLAVGIPAGPTVHVTFPINGGTPPVPIVHISDQSSLPLPLPLGFSALAAFPADVDANGATGSNPNVATGGDDSNNFAQLNWNLGVAASQLFPIIAPLFNPVPVTVPPLFGTVTPITASIGVGADMVQNFTLTMQQLAFDVVLEDGTPYELGEQIINASDHDLDGDGVEFTVVMNPHAQLVNDTDVGVNFSWNLDLLDAHIGVPLIEDDILDFFESILDELFDIFGEEGPDIPDSIGIDGPLVDLGQNDIRVATIDVLQNEFALAFQSQDAMFVA
jgi:hypothetical protein